MRRAAVWLGRIVLVPALAVAALWLFGPREPVETAVTFDRPLSADGLDTYFAAAEGRYDDITPGAEKRVIWAGAPGAVTDLALVYLHGFSATSEEIRPVPDRVAEGLGANLVYARLAGHGRGGAAMAEPTVADWMHDVAEALAAGRAAGREVVVIATSTGGTLAALAALDPDLARGVKGIVFVSPNFAIVNPAARLLTLPAARAWVPLVAGRERAFETLNEDHARWWTSRYPTEALVPMAALVRHAAARDFSAATVPALFVYAPADRVVSAAATEAVAAGWGGPATLAPQAPGPDDDPSAHVLAGDILSPGLTAPVAALILDWVRGL